MPVSCEKIQNSKDIFKRLACVHVCMHACKLIMCIPGFHSGQKVVLDSLKLELWMVVNLHVGGGELNPGHLEKH